MISLVSLLIKDAVYNFNNSMIKERKYCRGLMKKDFSKELVMIKEDDENFEKSTKLSDCNGTRTHNHLVRKRTLNHLA